MAMSKLPAEKGKMLDAEAKVQSGNLSRSAIAADVAKENNMKRKAQPMRNVVPGKGDGKM